MSRCSLMEIRVGYMDRTITDRNGKEILLKRVGFIDRSRYAGAEARKLRSKGVGQVRRIKIKMS